MHRKTPSGTLVLSFQTADFNECLVVFAAGVMVQPAASWTPKWMVGRRSFPFLSEWPIFRGQKYVSFVGRVENLYLKHFFRGKYPDGYYCTDFF